MDVCKYESIDVILENIRITINVYSICNKFKKKNILSIPTAQKRKTKCSDKRNFDECFDDEWAMILYSMVDWVCIEAISKKYHNHKQ